MEKPGIIRSYKPEEEPVLTGHGKGVGIDCDYLHANKIEKHNVRVDKANLFYGNPTLKYMDNTIGNVGPCDVLIRIKKVGLCGSDYHCLEKDPDGMILFSGPARFPQILGHEFVGFVEQTGKEVRHVHVGDCVACESVIWCGYCSQCRVGNFGACEHAELLGLTIKGALCEYIIVSQLHVWVINRLLDTYELDEALTLGALLEPLGCSYKALFHTARYKSFIGSKVAVFGAGPIGLGAAWLLKTSGADEVYIFEVNRTRIELAKAMGFEKVVDATTLDSISDYLHMVTKGNGVQLSVECSGAGNEILADIIHSTAAKGVILYLSRTGKTQFNIDFDRIMSYSITIMGSRGHDGTFPYLINALCKRENSYISQMVTKQINLDEVIHFLNQGYYRHHGKIMVNI